MGRQALTDNAAAAAGNANAGAGDNADANRWRQVADEVLAIESAAVSAMRQSVDENFIRAARLIVGTRGKVICSGVGKSGYVAGKFAATLSSTGTPAFFMSPSDAGHGDLGMVDENDTLALISYSGESAELLDILPALKRMNASIIAIVGAADSRLAQAASCCLLAGVEKEACPHNLAPTASTTAAMALCDALAMTALTARGFSPGDFARTHPAGKLGRQLLLRVRDIMRPPAQAPIVPPTAAFAQVLLEMTGKEMGMTLVCDDGGDGGGGNAGALRGIITDGDLRRALEGRADILSQTAQTLMTPNPVTVAPEMLAADALRLMKEKSLNHLIAVDSAGGVAGALSIHNMLQHRIL